MSGWVSLNRSIQDHWLNKEKRTRSKFEAWIDILLLANHQTNKVILGNEVIVVSRGSFITSEIKLMGRWGWSKSKLRAFLNLLQKEQMIKIVADSKKTTITVVKYDDYQQSKTNKKPEKDQSETNKKPSSDTNNNDNNEKEIIKKAFDGFWDFYNKKANRKDCFEKWMKLVNLGNIDHVRSSLKIYISKTPDVQYRKNPLTWLNGQCWLDYPIDAKPELGRINDSWEVN